MGRDIRLELPPEPGPNRHSDWSSTSSPPARMSPHSVPAAQPAQDQLNAPLTETTRSERFDVGNVDIALQTEPVREDQEVQAILVNNLEQNEENVDIIPPAPIRRAHLSLHVDDNSVTRSSQVRMHDIAGISSI